MGATVVITPEMQRANAETLLGKDPGKHRDPGLRWTQTRYKDILRQIKQMEADKPVTILNLNTFPLKINGGVYFPDEIPGCPQGKQWTRHVIVNTIWGHKDLGCDAQNMMQMEPVPAVPLIQASEYIREYVQQGSSSNSDDSGFGGVIAYLGDKDPSTIKKGELIRVPTIAYNELGEFYVELVDRDFHETLNNVTRKRNESLLRRIEAANSWHESEGRRINISDKERDMARLAFSLGLITELPKWVLNKHLQVEKQADPCPSCQALPKTGAILCINCGHIFDVVAAYKNARIAYGAVEMDRLTAEEWVVVNKIKAERDRARGVKA